MVKIIFSSKDIGFTVIPNCTICVSNIWCHIPYFIKGIPTTIRIIPSITVSKSIAATCTESWCKAISISATCVNITITVAVNRFNCITISTCRYLQTSIVIISNNTIWNLVITSSFSFDLDTVIWRMLNNQVLKGVV